jgi:hypothetical protein
MTMAIKGVLAGVLIAIVTVCGARVATAQSTAGAEVAKGATRPMGKPFSGRLSLSAIRDAPPTASADGPTGMLYAVLDGKGKLAINGTFERLASPATGANFHRGADGMPGPTVGTLSVTKGTSGVIKGDILLNDDDIAALQKGTFYVQIDTGAGPGGAVRGWLLAGMLK